MLNLKPNSNISIVLWLLVIWLFTDAIVIYRINSIGAFTSLGSLRTLEYIQKNGHADPATVRLNQSYTSWALALNMTDPSNYIKTGLGFAEGKGLNLKNINPTDPTSFTYIPYYFQGPGTPLVIGFMIKLFGERNILPYFMLVGYLHFITALLTCVLASKFLEDKFYVFIAGVLSLLYPAVLAYHFGIGLFASEPLVMPFMVLSLIALTNFWQGLNKGNYSYTKIILNALAYGGVLGCASYFRDIYASYALFSFFILLLSALLKRKWFKQIALFVLVGSIIMFAVEYPWQKRNQKYFGEFTMSGSSYCGFSMWQQVWSNPKETDQWIPNGAVGLGYYLAPEKSKEVLELISKDKKAGNRLAWHTFIEVLVKNPIRALTFKLSPYDTLWFGQRYNWYIYLWCMLSTLSFMAFLFITRFKFEPALWIFPLFLIGISVLAHYEHRYVEPFFLFVTPITVAYIISYFRKRITRAI